MSGLVKKSDIWYSYDDWEFSLNSTAYIYYHMCSFRGRLPQPAAGLRELRGRLDELELALHIAEGAVAKQGAEKLVPCTVKDVGLEAVASLPARMKTYPSPKGDGGDYGNFACIVCNKEVPDFVKAVRLTLLYEN